MEETGNRPSAVCVGTEGRLAGTNHRQALRAVTRLVTCDFMVICALESEQQSVHFMQLLKVHVPW